MSIYNDHKPPTGGGDYLKLKDGDKVKLRIASEPAISIYKKGDRFRYAWVVYNRNAEKAQIYTAGVTVFTAIADLVDEWGEPTEFDISVKRTGSGIQDTSYSVTPVKISKDLTNEELEEVNKIDLLNAIKGKMLSDYEKDGILPSPMKEDEYISEEVPLEDMFPE